MHLAPNIGGGLLGANDVFVRRAKRHLVIIAGQSNADNTALVSELTDTSFATAFPAVRYMVKLGNAADPPTVVQYGAQDLDDLLRSSQQRMGIELSLGRDLDHSLADKWAIGKFAYSATSLISNWDPFGTFPTSDPTNLVAQFIAFVQQAEQDTNSKLAAIVWIQGETDAFNSAAATGYDDNLIELVGVVRAALGTVPWIYGRLNAQYVADYAAETRTAQAAADGALTDLIMMDQDSVPLGADVIHYDADGVVALGHLYAPEVLGAMGLNSVPFAGFTYVEDGLELTFADTSTDADGSIASWAWDFGDGNVSTSQNPVHTYATDGTYTVSLTVTDNTGAVDTYEEEIGVDGIAWTIDGGIGIPANNTEFQAVIDSAGVDATADVPTSIYLHQDTAAPLADVNGVVTLGASGTGHNYQVAFTGHTGKSVQLTDGTSASWQSTAAAIPDISTTSCTMLCILEFPAAAPAATRIIMAMGTSVLATVRFNVTTGLISTQSGANTDTSTVDARGLILHIWLQVDQTNNVQRVIIKRPGVQQTRTPTFSGTLTGKAFRVGSSGAASAVKYRATYRWDGASAEMPEATMIAISDELGMV